MSTFCFDFLSHFPLLSIICNSSSLFINYSTSGRCSVFHKFQGSKILMTEKDLNGTSRVAVEGFSTEEECKMLIKLAEVCNFYEPLLMINQYFCYVPCVAYSIIVFVFVKGEKYQERVIKVALMQWLLTDFHYFTVFSFFNL